MPERGVDLSHRRNGGISRGLALGAGIGRHAVSPAPPGVYANHAVRGIGAIFNSGSRTSEHFYAVDVGDVDVFEEWYGMSATESRGRDLADADPVEIDERLPRTKRVSPPDAGKAGSSSSTHLHDSQPGHLPLQRIRQSRTFKAPVRAARRRFAPGTLETGSGGLHPTRSTRLPSRRDCQNANGNTAWRVPHTGRVFSCQHRQHRRAIFLQNNRGRGGTIVTHSVLHHPYASAKALCQETPWHLLEALKYYSQYLLSLLDSVLTSILGWMGLRSALPLCDTFRPLLRIVQQAAQTRHRLSSRGTGIPHPSPEL